MLLDRSYRDQKRQNSYDARLQRVDDCHIAFVISNEDVIASGFTVILRHTTEALIDIRQRAARRQMERAGAGATAQHLENRQGASVPEFLKIGIHRGVVRSKYATCSVLLRLPWRPDLLAHPK
jgi:hypothetical protein